MRCNGHVTTLEPDGSNVCSSCQHRDIADALPPELWADLDPHIFANQKLPAMKRLAATLDGGLGAAIRVYTARYDHLRETSPDSFNQSHDDYWAGFLS